MVPTLQVQLLGDFRLTCRERPVTGIDSPRLQSLLAYLVLHRDAPQSRRYLSFLFWPDSTEKQARTNLRQLLHHLRRALPEADRFLEIDAKTLQWRADAPFSLDVAEFESALIAVDAAEAAGDPIVRRAALERVVESYPADLLPGCYEEWIEPERERLREEYGAALERLIALLEQERDYAGAIRYGERLLRQDPLREASYRLLMRLHALNRDRAGALRVYERCAAVLERELDIPPGPAIQEMYDRLLRLELPREEAPRANPAASLPLVGRRHEWEQLRAAWYVAARGRAQLFLVAGEAGIGKTRLAEELLEWAARQGIATARARSFAAQGRLAYSPVTEWLRSAARREAFSGLDPVWLAEIARLVPEVRTGRPELPPPEPLTESWQRRRFFEALARALLVGDQPLLLLIDDLQWCDRESLEWLRFLLHFAPTARLLVLATVRSEEVEPDHPLLPLIRGLGQEGQIGELALGPLDAAETASLAAAVAGADLDAGRAARLFSETEGNPLFVVESVRAGMLGDAAPPHDRTEEATSPASLVPASPPLPPTVHAVITARLAQLSPLARQLGDLAATIGRAFSLDVLARASDLEEEALVRGLDELCRRHVVREQDDLSYDFTHDKLREVAYARISGAGQRMLHHRVAQALEAVHAADLDSVSGQVAAHYERAGSPVQALHYHRRAAEVAQRLYAHAEAAGHLRRGLELLRHLPAGHGREARELELQIALGLSLVPLEGYGAVEVHASCDRVRALSRSLGEPVRPPVLRTLALGKLAAGDPAGAGELGAELAAQGEQLRDPIVEVEGHYLLGVVRFWQGDFPGARDHLERALRLYNPQQQRTHLIEYAQDPAVICRIRFALCLWYLGYPERARAESEAALTFARDLAHPLSMAYALNYATWLSAELGDTGATEEQANAALAVAHEHQLAFWPPSASVLRGWVRVRQGELQAGISETRRGITSHREMRQPLHLPYALVLLARAYRRTGEVEHGLETLTEADALMDRTGIRFLESEVRRLRGELLAARDGDGSDAGHWFRQALEIARRQGAMSLELRAAISLGRWCRQGGRRAEARQQLERVLTRFTEGFDTPDLRTARQLREELS
jgi:DNA-binding SARP family transcriptional activator/predicted ATPase